MYPSALQPPCKKCLGALKLYTPTVIKDKILLLIDDQCLVVPLTMVAQHAELGGVSLE